MEITLFFTILEQLERQATVISSLTSNVSNEQARWKPDPKSWSLLEVMCHLLDEEREDFRAHLDHLLHTPEKPWPKISPQAWVTERDYNQKDLAKTLEGFRTERARSLKWLRTLPPFDLDAVCVTPWGQIRAGDLLASWAAHDLLHIRQFTELHWAYLAASTGTYATLYAGDW